MPENPISSFFGMIRDVAENRSGPVSDILRQAAPKCHVCGAITLIPRPCRKCGRYACESHGFFSASEMFCADCVSTSGLMEAPDRKPQARQRRPNPANEYPWADLGIKPTHDVETIKKSFREKATATHPDRGGDPAAFTRIKAAYDEALRFAEGKGQ